MRQSLVKFSIFIFLLLLAGCGGGDSTEFVVGSSGGNAAPPPPPPAPGTTGNLTFRFAQAQTGTLPTGTQKLQFDFFNAEGGLEFFGSADYATSVTVRDVPVTSIRVVITAYGPGGVPLATLTKAITVSPDETVAVSLSDAQTAVVTLVELLASPSTVSLTLPNEATAQIQLRGRFSNSETVVFSDQTGGRATYTGFNTTVATVEANGTVRGVTAGATSVNVSFTLNGQTAQATVPIRVTGNPLGPARLVFSPPTVAMQSNSTANVTVTYFGPGANEGTDVTSQATGLTTLPSVTYAAGTVTASSAITNATSTVVLVTFNSGAGPVSGTFTVNVTPPTPPVPPSLGRLVVSPRTITIRNDGLLGLLALGSDYTGLGFIEAEFIPNGQTVGNDVSKQVGVSFKNFFPSTVTPDSFSYLYLLGDGVLTTAHPLGPKPPENSTCTMTVSYVFNGAVYTDEVTVIVGTPALDRVEVLGAVNGTIRLPSGRTGDRLLYRIQAVAHYTNGFFQPVDLFSGGPTEFDDTFDVVANPLLTDPPYNLTDDEFTTEESTSVSLPFEIVNTSSVSPVVETTFSLQLIDGLTVDSVDIVPSSIVVDDVNKYRVFLTYSDGTRLDVTGIWPVESLGGNFSIDTGSGCGCADVNMGYLLGDFVGMDELNLGSVSPIALGLMAMPGLATATFGTNNVPVNVLSVLF